MLCDENDTYVLAQTVSLPTKYSVDVGKALGLFNVLQWLTNMQFDSVNFMIDSQVTIDAFNLAMMKKTKQKKKKMMLSILLGMML